MLRQFSFSTSLYLRSAVSQDDRKSGLRARVGTKRMTCLGLAIFTLVLPVGAFGQGKEAHDSITVQADAVALPGVPPSTIVLQDEMSWADLYDKWKFSSVSSRPSCVAKTADKDQAYIFHVAHWVGADAGKPPRLSSSSWSAYGSKVFNSDKLVRKLAPNGDPLIYGKQRILLISVHIFDDDKNGAGTLSIRDKSSVTQGIPENAQALTQLVSSLLGLTAAAKAAQGAILISFDCQEGTAHLPFDLNIVETIGLPESTAPPDPKQKPGTDPASASADPITDLNPGSSEHSSARGTESDVESISYTEPNLHGSSRVEEISEGRSSTTRGSDAGGSSSQQGGASPGDGTDGSSQDNSAKPASQSTPKAGQADCSSLSAKNPCTVSRTLTSLDKEWWDVSLAVSIPGVRESKYSISSSKLQSMPTTHTDLYALFDIYWSAKWWTKNSGAPHLAIGLPVTGQTFYRPAFGLSENLTGWNRFGRTFPVPINFFAGVVDMKTTTVKGAPTTAAELTADSATKRIWKAIFGVEVPVSALISKVGKGSKSTNANAGGNGGKNGNQGSTATQ